jgi:hypothetical protein
LNKSILSGIVGAVIGAGAVSAALIPQYYAMQTANLAQDKQLSASLSALTKGISDLSFFQVQLMLSEIENQGSCHPNGKLNQGLKQPVQVPIRQVW